jgi:hypothetical protein
MLSKCANPVCSATFRYLHQGRIFQLVLTPAAEMATENGLLRVERFWLCDTCSIEMNVIWDGARAKVVRRPENEILNRKALSPTPGNAPSPMKDRPYQDRLYQERLAQERLVQERLAQERLSQNRPTNQTPPRVTPLPTKLPPTRLRAAFAGRRPR